MSYKAGLTDFDYYKGEIECLAACPVFTDARGYVTAVSAGRYEEAYAIAREANPFASICGKVCAAPCEKACRKGDVDPGRPVMIRGLKGFLTGMFGPESRNHSVLNTVLAGLNEHGLQGEFDIRVLKNYMGTRGIPDSSLAKNGKRVAVIGSGCAGLTAAHDLAVLGHKVTVFEAENIAGGMLVQGVPVFRLPRELVNAEIASITGMGVEIRLNTKIGRDVSLDNLFEQGFDAVLIATGLQEGRPLDIPGKELQGILPGINFLRENNLGRKAEVGERVVVIGGGDVAMDCGRVALRKGAKSVKIVCLEDRSGMKAADFEIKEAEEEGIQMITSFGPQKFTGKDGLLTGIEIKKVTSLLDKNGRFNPVFDAESAIILEADTVITAIGQVADIGFIKDDPQIRITPSRTIAVDPVRLTTDRKAVFSAGDIATGPKLFIDAVRQGHIAARSVHEFLSGKKLEVERSAAMEEIPAFYTVNRHGFEFCRPPANSPAERCGNNRLVETGYSPDEAEIQAKRCFSCDINVVMRGNRCIACNGCVDVCPEGCLKLVNLDLLEETGLINDVIGFMYDIPRTNIVLGSHYPLNLERGMAMLFDPARCIRCGLCHHYCPTYAITMEKFTFSETLNTSE